MFAGSVKMAVRVITEFPRALESSGSAACHGADHGDPVGGTSVLQICPDCSWLLTGGGNNCNLDI